ncbi:ABC transporter ATP-binding protein [candidate division WWE3 bacterium]|nr:ABC transporter ATP-binding protein [candidate division WWE3 bacterium]
MGQGPAEKANNFKGTIKKLTVYLKPHWINIILVLVFSVASTVFAIVSPKILGHATNQIVDDYVSIKAYDQITSQLPPQMNIPAGATGADMLNKLPSQVKNQIPSSQLEKIMSLDLTHRPVFHFDAIAQIVVLLIGLYLLSALLSYIQGWIMTSVTQKVTNQFRKEISGKINRLPLSYFDTRTYGEVLSRVTNDIDTVSQTLNQSLSQIITSVIMILGITIMMLSISWLLTVVTILILPLSFVLIGLIMKKSQALFVKQQAGLGLLNGHIEEMYAGHLVMRIFNGQKDSIAKFNTINDDLYHSAWLSQFLSGLIFPLMTFIGNLGYVAVSVVGGWLAVNGKINIGDIQAFIQYVQQFNQPITQTANIANIMQSTAAAAERVFEFLDEPEESKESTNPVELLTVKGQVEFDQVMFGYQPDRIIINNLSASIKPGQRVAIVGPTGAGKTTLVNLLMRFYDVQGGSIKIDGVDIRDMKRSDVRKLFGMVLQDTWLFNGTIRDNITYGNPEASEEDIIHTAKEAHVDHFVRSLPSGYDMVINEEANNISQGEKQLLTIARAMLAKTPMLILDEATSSVDTRTEVLIQKAMDNLMQNKTSFVIAHRLSTIRNADLILVMKDGNVIEQGTHQSLLEQNGFYASLYNSQFSSEE